MRCRRFAALIFLDTNELPTCRCFAAARNLPYASMSLYEMPRTIFSRSEKNPPAPIAEWAPASASNPNGFDRTAYIIKHLAEIEQEIPFFTGRHGANFHDLLYRPAVSEFIHNGILPFRKPALKYTDFLLDTHWREKNNFNFPGPFYTGDSDNCGSGDYEAPDNVLYDEQGREYVFRQPQNFVEFLCVVDAASVETFGSYSCDGNDHWTYSLCQEWWRGKAELISHLKTPAFHETNSDRVRLYLDYLNGAAATDLRKYCYFLENGRYPTATEPLPPL